MKIIRTLMNKKKQLLIFLILLVLAVLFTVPSIKTYSTNYQTQYKAPFIVCLDTITSEAPVLVSVIVGDIARYSGVYDFTIVYASYHPYTWWYVSYFPLIALAFVYLIYGLSLYLRRYVIKLNFISIRKKEEPKPEPLEQS